MLGWIYQHYVVLIEHARVAINQDLQVTFVLEMHPRMIVTIRARCARAAWAQLPQRYQEVR
jgi:hypothetical protein